MFNPTPRLHDRVLLTANTLDLAPGCELLCKAQAVRDAMAAGDPLSVASADRELMTAYIACTNRGA